MTAIEKREELEGYLWRLFARRRKAPEGQLVASVLAAADAYAEAVADQRVAERIAGIVADANPHRARLEACAAEKYGAPR